MDTRLSRNLERITPLAEVIEFFEKHLPNDPVIIDAGAFNGKDSQALAQKWPNGSVHSFEPVPEIFSILAQTAAETPNMSIYPYALSNENGYPTCMFQSAHPSRIRLPDPAR